MQDHFYVCPGHLKDRGYCTPIIDEAEAAAKKRQEELDREIESIKKEYEEKMKKRKKSKDLKKKEKNKEEGKDKKPENTSNNDKDEDEVAEKEKNDKIKALVDKGPLSTVEAGPRIFALQKYTTHLRISLIKLSR
ncbi:MAG: hypothetical protein Q9219_000163 [cf. Caloplaca sp. 3 TL-2023]